MGGDDSQKLLPWRGSYSSPGRKPPAPLRINTLTQTRHPIRRDDWRVNGVVCGLGEYLRGSATGRLGHSWKAQAGHSWRAPKIGGVSKRISATIRWV
jgi:hypothetical protein